MITDDYLEIAEGAKGKTSDYTTAIIPNGFKGLRIGIPRYGFYNASITGLDQYAYDITETILSKMADLGAIVINNTNLPSTDEFYESGNSWSTGNETMVLQTEFKVDLAKYLSELQGDVTVKSLEDVINFNDRHAAIEMPEGQCCQG